jgi:hypothetical protein
MSIVDSLSPEQLAALSPEQLAALAGNPAPQDRGPETAQKVQSIARTPVMSLKGGGEVFVGIAKADGTAYKGGPKVIVKVPGPRGGTLATALSPETFAAVAGCDSKAVEKLGAAVEGALPAWEALPGA